MKENKAKYETIFKQFLEEDKNIESIKDFCDTENGIIKDIRYKGKQCLAKVTEKLDGIDYAKNLKGPNLVKIYKILETEYDKKMYNMIVMEKAVLRDLGMLNEHLKRSNCFRLYNKPFFEIIGNNLVKFLTKGIVKGLETLDRNELVHYNIKPSNLLITSELKIKISDFSFLINLKDYIKNNENLKLPETRGYVTPEFFKNNNVSPEDAKKQDYFALGASLFFFRRGDQLLTKRKNNDDLSEDRLIDLLQRDIALIQSNPLYDNKFVDFICDLMRYVPEERPNIEEIYRNEWLNEDLNDLFLLNSIYLKEEEDKFIRELLKSDFTLKKSKEINEQEKNRANFKFVE